MSRVLPRVLLPAILVLLPMSAHADEGTDACGDTVPAVIETNRGAIRIALDRANAPKTVDNFIVYAQDDFFAGTVFHRVIPDFMIQGGGLTADLERKPTRDPVVNESGNGLSNDRGTLAMARTRDPDSATSQFFINLVDNRRLDGRNGMPGYTVFAQVTEGMDVVDEIARVPTTRRDGRADVPEDTVTIEQVRIEVEACKGDAEDGA
jgi:cyclophilin family peptidyl-prolyl cis-trans isomerase